VKGAKVVLEGTVPSRHMKHAIEDLVDACPGVQDIDNRIRVVSERAGSQSVGQATSGQSASGPWSASQSQTARSGEGHTGDSPSAPTGGPSKG
jgi:hypothetical protein